MARKPDRGRPTKERILRIAFSRVIPSAESSVSPAAHSWASEAARFVQETRSPEGGPYAIQCPMYYCVCFVSAWSAGNHAGSVSLIESASNFLGGHPTRSVRVMGPTDTDQSTICCRVAPDIPGRTHTRNPQQMGASSLVMGYKSDWLWSQLCL
jgi:hypothetical protein